MLTEIVHPPKIMTNIPAIIQQENFKKELDSYLKNRSPATFPSELRSKLSVVSLIYLVYCRHLCTQLVSGLVAKLIAPCDSDLLRFTYYVIWLMGLLAALSGLHHYSLVRVWSC